MHPPKFLRRRPSAAIVIAMIALFAALAGAGYAAVSIPKNSVGTNQLKNGAVSNAKIKNGAVGNFKLATAAVGARKIINGAVGRGQINTNQVQERVTGVCTSGAITSVSVKGAATCAQAPGADFNTANPNPVAVTTGLTPIASEQLAGGSNYLVTANPQINVSGNTGSTESVEVDCTLAVGPSASATQTRTMIVDLGANPQAQTLSLAVPAPSSPNAVTAALFCNYKTAGSSTPKVTASTSLNAVQTASDTAEPYTG